VPTIAASSENGEMIILLYIIAMLILAAMKND
jgi:hypothetical protein